MADDKHFVLGDFYRIDDRSGFKVRARRTKKEWTGLIVNEYLWEARQPQDFVKGVRDDQTVPDPRPRQTNQFLGPLQTTIAANGVAGDISVDLASVANINIGDTVQIMLDSGVELLTTILEVGEIVSLMLTEVGGSVMDTESGIDMETEDTASTDYIVIADPLPSSVSIGNLVTDWTFQTQPNINQ